MKTKVQAEWHSLSEVMIHRPGIEMFFGLLEPDSFLYERAFSMDEAIHEHMELEHQLIATGAKVYRLKRLAITLSKEKPELINNARRYASRIIRFEGSKLAAEKAYNSFKKNVELMDPETIFNILLLRPSVFLRKKVIRGSEVTMPEVRLATPLSNLYFMRDQQAVTDEGVVIGRMSKPQRSMEPIITEAVLSMAGAEIVYHVKHPGIFEGGDFMPALEFALIGMGDRTNFHAIKQIMDNGLGFEEVCIVHQPAHPLIPYDQPDPMVNMHIDTYLNFAGNRLAVGCIPLIGKARVEVYRKNSGQYKKVESNKTLQDYLVGKGYEFIPITTLEQLCYASNFLCVSDRKIIAVEVEKLVDKVIKNLEKKASSDPHRYSQLFNQAVKDYRLLKETGEFFPHKRDLRENGVEFTPVLLQEITGGYGGAHCMTCVLSRKG